MTHISRGYDPQPRPGGGIQGQREVLGGQAPGDKEGEAEECGGALNYGAH